MSPRLAAPDNEAQQLLQEIDRLAEARAERAASRRNTDNAVITETGAKLADRRQ